MLYDNKKWIEDIDKVIEVVPELDDLAGKSLMITGAAGLVPQVFRQYQRY